MMIAILEEPNLLKAAARMNMKYDTFVKHINQPDFKLRIAMFKERIVGHHVSRLSAAYGDAISVLWFAVKQSGPINSVHVAAAKIIVEELRHEQEIAKQAEQLERMKLQLREVYAMIGRQAPTDSTTIEVEPTLQ